MKGEKKKGGRSQTVFEENEPWDPHSWCDQASSASPFFSSQMEIIK